MSARTAERLCGLFLDFFLLQTYSQHMATTKDLIKTIQKAVGTTVDGIVGPKTLQAVARKLSCEATWKAIQTKVKTTVDGIPGPKTYNAIIKALGTQVETPKPTKSPASVRTSWPTQAQVRKGTSIFGKAGDESNLVNIVPPYPMKYDGKVLKTIRVHKEIAPTVKQILQEVLDYYGLEKIQQLGLDDYSGCYNYRKTTNGSSLSMHAWGVAFDFAAAKNTYAMKKPKASLSKPECEMWWKIWEKYGAVSLGRARGYDWMHVQLARLS